MTTQVMEIPDKRNARDDARLILVLYHKGQLELEHALDLLGFGEPIPDEPRATGFLMR